VTEAAKSFDHGFLRTPDGKFITIDVPGAGGYGTIPVAINLEGTVVGYYTDANFLQALRRGVRADGAHLYPAMPYASYTYMTDADALAIKAYLLSLTPVKARAPSNGLVFPFNQRWLMGIWSWLFNPDQRFEPNPAQSPEWNRGAYLTEAMEHCGECHTPRNLFQALDNRRKFAGTTQAGWRAYNITADRSSGVGAFSDTDLSAYLATGHANGHGTAAGPMGEAVDKSLSQLAPSDIAAITAAAGMAVSGWAATRNPIATPATPKRRGSSIRLARKALASAAVRATAAAPWGSASAVW